MNKINWRRISMINCLVIWLLSLNKIQKKNLDKKPLKSKNYPQRQENSSNK